MTTERILIKAYEAKEDIPPRRLVTLDSDSKAVLTDNATAPIGVSHPQMTTNAGGTCDVLFIGITEVEMGGVVVPGLRLAADAQGRGIAATSGKRHSAMALEAPTAAGDIIRALVIQGAA